MPLTPPLALRLLLRRGMTVRALATSPACSPAAAVQAVDLVRTYRQGTQAVAALRGVSLTVGIGEFVAIMGPSGSGKSTLLHLLGGIELADSGRVVIAGQFLAALSDDELTVFRRRSIGVVFQAYNLLPTLSAEENVALPLQLDGVPTRTVRARVAESLTSVGMLPRRSHRPDQLSGGEQQRVAIARALVVAPVLVLADEPTGSLDSRTAAEVLGLLDHAARTQGRTIVMVTHDAHAASHADRIVHVVDGAIDDATPGTGAKPCALGAS